MDQIDFRAPIKLGQLVNLKASVNYVGRSSMEVGVRVEAEDTMTGKRVHAASAFVTFVGISKKGKPRKVPALRPETSQQKIRWEAAKVRRKQRLALARERRRLAEQHQPTFSSGPPKR